MCCKIDDHPHMRVLHIQVAFNKLLTYMHTYNVHESTDNKCADRNWHYWIVPLRDEIEKSTADACF